MGWLALSTVGVVLFVVLIWSVVGTIPELVDGQGVLIRGERLSEVKASVGGTLVSISVNPDTEVAPGQVLAVIARDRTEIEEKIAMKREQLNRLRAQHAGENSADEMNQARNQSMIGIKRSELASLRTQRQNQQELVNKGLKPGNVLFDFDRRISGVTGEINSLERENTMVRTRMAPRENEERQTEAEIQQLQNNLERTTTEVRSPEAGRIVEVLKSANDKLREGDVLLRLEVVKATVAAPGQREFCAGNIHAVMYIAGNLAGKVKPGQAARVSPSDVKKEEYGFMVGQVAWVSNFAASPDDMREKLKNDSLVQTYRQNGPVFEARVCLTPDEANKFSGFRWSSSQGPPKRVDSGSMATASLVVDQRKPYTYVVPAVRRATGL
jgi:HlyD family secretion protein